MSHEIMENDTIVSTEKCWHGLERIEETITFDNSGLNWELVKAPTYFEVDGQFYLNSTEKTVVRKDIKLPIFTPKDSYGIIQNSRMWEILENSLEGVDYTVKVTGSLKNCGIVFFSVDIEDESSLITLGDDQFKNYLTFMTSHNGTCKLTAYDTSIRVVCNNTLQYSLANKGQINLSIRHTKNAEERIENMEKVLHNLFDSRRAFYKNYERMANKRIHDDRARDSYQNLLIGDREPDSKRGETRLENSLAELMGLFQAGKGNRGESVADWLNGATEYYTHYAGGNNTRKRFQSNEIGAYRNKKAEALSIAQNILLN